MQQVLGLSSQLHFHSNFCTCVLLPRCQKPELGTPQQPLHIPHSPFLLGFLVPEAAEGAGAISPS